MKRYYIKVEDKKVLAEVNGAIITDSLFTVGESFEKDQLHIGDNFTDNSRVFASVLKYQQEKQLINYNNFEFCDLTSFDRFGSKIELNDNFIIIDGYKMKLKYKPSYTYMCRKTFVGTNGAEELAKILVQEFWRTDTKAIIAHVRRYGKKIA